MHHLCQAIDQNEHGVVSPLSFGKGDDEVKQDAIPGSVRNRQWLQKPMRFTGQRLVALASVAAFHEARGVATQA